MKRKKQLKQAEIQPWNGSPHPQQASKLYFCPPDFSKKKQIAQKYKKYDRMLSYQSQKAKQIEGLTNFIQKNKKLISDQYLFPDLQKQNSQQNKSNLIFQNKYLIKQFDNTSFTPIKKKHEEIKKLYRRQFSLSTTVLSYIDIQKQRKHNLSILARQRRSFSANPKSIKQKPQKQQSQKQRFNRLIKLKNKNSLKKNNSPCEYHYQSNQSPLTNKMTKQSNNNDKIKSERIHSFKFLRDLSVQIQQKSQKKHLNMSKDQKNMPANNQKKMNKYFKCKEINKNQNIEIMNKYQKNIVSYKQRLSNFLLKGSCLDKNIKVKHSVN